MPRPDVDVRAFLGIDAPPVVGSAVAIPPTARARLSLRIPPGTDPGRAHEALVAHLEANTPWHAKLTVELEGIAAPFRSGTGGPARAGEC